VNSGLLTIGIVSRQSGVEASTLRKWESRYGFPQPLYLASGQRRYSKADVENIRCIVRRVDAGERVGKVIRDFLHQLIPDICKTSSSRTLLVDEALSALVRLDLGEFKSVLETALTESSVLGFVEQFVSPLAEAVGARWAAGILPVYGEHLFSALIESKLLQIADQASLVDHQPKVLLVTLSGETHTLGLAMANAVISSAGISCLRLPSHMPLGEIAECALAFRVRIVGISVSRYYPPRLLQGTIGELRRILPEEVELWIGGAGINRIRKIPSGTKPFVSWVAVIAAFHELMRCR
jgi:DNA-binding transcriptional MerR regulator/methylmalonyl-CoA mutase cobalamin-binding subunit